MDQVDKDFELLDFVEFFGEEDWLQSDDATQSSTSTTCNVSSVFNSFRDPSQGRPPNGTRKKRRKAHQVSRCKVVVSRGQTPSTAGDKKGRGGSSSSSSGNSRSSSGGGDSSTDEGNTGVNSRDSATEDAALRKQFRRASFILNSILRHYNNGDGGGLGDFYRANCTDNFEYHEYSEDPATGTDASGKVELDRGIVGVEAYAKLINDAFEATPDGVLTLYEMTLKENGKLVVCKCTVAGTVMAPFEFPDAAHEVAEISSAASEAVAKVDAPASSLLAPVEEDDHAAASELPPAPTPTPATAPPEAAAALPRGAPVRYSANGTLAFTLDPETDKIARIDSHFHVPTTVMLTLSENSTLASAAASASTSRANSPHPSGKN